MADMLEQGYGQWAPADLQFWTPTLSIFMDAVEHEEAMERAVIPASITLSATSTDLNVFTSSTWLPKGTIMGYASSSTYTGKWIPYSSAATDGSQLPAGILAEGVTVPASDITAYVFTRGRFNNDALTAITPITPPKAYNSHQLIIETGATT